MKGNFELNVCSILLIFFSPSFILHFPYKVILGSRVSRPTTMDVQLAGEILEAQRETKFLTRLGTTMCTDDFFEGKPIPIMVTSL